MSSHVDYLLKRLFLLVPVLFIVSAAIFLLLRIIPGDPALLVLTGPGGGGQASPDAVAKVRAQLGLDRPIYAQYFSWLWSLLRLEGARSYVTGGAVLPDIAPKILVTIQVALLSTVLSILVAVPLGIISAMKPDSWVDMAARLLSVSGLCIPSFWTATLVVVSLSRFFGWVPPLGFVTLFDDPWTNIQQIIWPVLILAYHNAAVISRMTRSGMLEVLRQEYVRTARSKGLRERYVILRHSLRNALLPVVTIMGVQFSILLSGAVIVETIFSVPGLGRQMIVSILNRDYPTVETIVAVFAFFVVLSNLLIDLLYTQLDPRVELRT